MRSDDARVNILVFLLVAGVVFVALVLFARYPGLFASGVQYRTSFHSVAGLNRGDEVRYGGLLVGTVTEMDLDPADPTRVLVLFNVREKTPVATDTRATVGQVGLLGEPYLDLSPGSPGAPRAKEGAMLPSSETLSLQEAMTRLARFIDRSDTLMTRLQSLDVDAPLARLDRTLARVEALVQTTGERSDRVLAQVEGAGQQLSGVLERSDRLLAVLDTTVRTAGPGLADTQREAVAALREARQLVGDIRDGLQQQGGVDQLVRDLAVTTDNLARLTTRLERDPTSVLKRRDAVRKTVGPSVR
jgi:phospholipid/cholesterol/gamma-HCH transport system substrate-binding protein